MVSCQLGHGLEKLSALRWARFRPRPYFVFTLEGWCSLSTKKDRAVVILSAAKDLLFLLAWLRKSLTFRYRESANKRKAMVSEEHQEVAVEGSTAAGGPSAAQADSRANQPAALRMTPHYESVWQTKCCRFQESCRRALLNAGGGATGGQAAGALVECGNVRREHLPQALAGAEEPCFNRAHRDAQDFRRFLGRHTLDVP